MKKMKESRIKKWENEKMKNEKMQKWSPVFPCVLSLSSHSSWAILGQYIETNSMPEYRVD